MSELSSFLLNARYGNNFVETCFKSIDTGEKACKALFFVPMPVNAPIMTQANKAYRVRSIREVITLFGTKNVAYSAMALALCACANSFSTEINVVALPNPTTNVASKYDLLITGAATADHVKTFRFMNYDANNPISISIANGLSVVAQAALYKTAFDLLPDFPYTVAVAATGLTFTANDKGIYGNGLNFFITDSRDAFQVITDNAITVTQAATGNGGLDLTGYKDPLGRCCYQCVYSADNTPATINDIQTWGEAKGTCFVSSCFQSLYWGSKEAVSILTNFGNLGNGGQPYNKRNVGLALKTDSLLLSWQFSAARAALSCCVGCNNPANPIQNSDSRISCLPCFSDCSKGWSDEDYEALWDAGWTPVECIDGLYGVRKEQYFSRFNENGNRDYNLSDPTVYRMLTLFNMLVQSALISEFGSTYMFKNGTSLPPVQNVGGQKLPDWFSNVRGTTPDNVRAALIRTLNKLKGRILDEQDMEAIVYTFTDDVMRGCQAGNPRIVYNIMDKVRLARPIQQFRNFVQFTTSFC